MTDTSTHITNITNAIRRLRFEHGEMTNKPWPSALA